jgi:integrase
MSSPQIPLFAFSVPEYWPRLCEQVDRLMTDAPRSESTLRAYVSNWRAFEAWCSAANRSALPATSETIIEFITWALYERKYRLATVNVFLPAIAKKHREAKYLSPMTAEVSEFVARAKADLKEKPRQAAAMTPELLRKICRWLLDHAAEDPYYLRDRAMFLCQFGAGWRESEICALDLADIRFVRSAKPKVILSLGASKMDQTGETGRDAPVNQGRREETDPLAALKAWIQFRGSAPGPLFCQIRRGSAFVSRLDRATVNYRLKTVLERMGLDPKGYSSHSLRAGMVTTGILRGASESAIMLRTGHASLESMRKYIRAGQAIVTAADPLAGVL